MRASLAIWAPAWAAALISCEVPATRPVPLGDPLAELNAQEVQRFRAGEALFNHVFSPAEGLGPLFNDNQCSACHTSPVAGGTGEQLVVKVTRFTPPQSCDLLVRQGGENVRRQATPLLAERGINRQAMPQGSERARFSVPFIFGLGLIDAIPPDQILRNADPTDKNKDGISGRAGVNAEGKFARFGKKADQQTLRDFVESAAHQEMGLTTPQRRTEMSGSTVLPAGVDPAPEPELNEKSVQLLVDFVRFLAPPHQRAGESEEAQRHIARGKMLFHSSGCAACHIPSMTTARHESKALSRKRVDLYSDLLLHDLGEGLRNVCSAGATPTELRTAPLAGVGHKEIFLHDSRAHSLTEAILMHGGEAISARERFRRLHEIDQARLLRFLQSL